MASRFRDALGDLVPDILCAAAQSAEAPIDYLNKVRDGLLGTNSDPDGTAAGFESPIQKFLCGLGDNPNEPVFDPTTGLPGSCNANYFVFADITYTPLSGGGETTGSFNAGDTNQYPGPLGDATLEISGGGRITISFSNTNAVIIGPFTNRATQPTFELDLRRVDGQPDNCGSDGEPITGGGDGLPSGTGDVTYDDGTGTEVTEPYSFQPLPIYTSPDGDTIAPFEICVADECYNICYNVSTGTSQPCGSTRPNDPCCPIVAPVEGEPGPDDPPEPEDEARYSGVLVRCSFDDSKILATQQFSPAGLTLYIPRLAVVRFAIEVGGARTWTVDQPVKTKSQGVFVNAPAFAYAWDVLPENNVTVDVTPIVAPQ